MNRPGGPEEYSPGREAGATDKQSDRGPEGRKIDSHNLTPLRGWVQNGSKTPAFGRGYILSALRAYSFTPSTRLNEGRKKSQLYSPTKRSRSRQSRKVHVLKAGL